MPPPVADVEDRLLRAMLYAERHLRDELTVDRLAREACISEFHFHRMFRYRTGEPVMEFVRRLRLEHAAYRLRATRRRVREIAREVGYSSADAFGRAFRARFGDTPRQYRSRWSEREPVGPLPPRSAVTRPRVPVDVVVRRLPAWVLLCHRQIGPYHEAFRARQRLAAWMDEHRVPASDDNRFGISPDDPELVGPSAIRYDACRMISSDTAERVGSSLRPSLHVQYMPAGDYAVTIHHGPYHMLGDAYARLFLHWLPASGRYPAHAPNVERYVAPIGATAQSLTTELLLPLEPG